MDTFDFIAGSPPDLLSIVIEGQRIQLVAIAERFDRDIFREFTAEITRYMYPSPAQDIEEIRSFVLTSRQDLQIGNNLLLAIISKPEGEFLGCCGLHGEEKVRTPELGIWIKKSAHGNGYGREAIVTLVNWAERNIDLDYFIYPVDIHNYASRKIPESLGGKAIDRVQVTTPTGKFLDKVIYQIDSRPKQVK
jgi:[ribosomal protein S5]-alanine N-acetyltransferase